jgi:hypothetical protein
MCIMLALCSRNTGSSTALIYLFIHSFIYSVLLKGITIKECLLEYGSGHDLT